MESNKSYSLGLFGSKSSFYLRLVERHAQKSGIATVWVDRRQADCAAYVADTDSGLAILPDSITVEEDVDRIKYWGVSCAAVAALFHINLTYPVVIIGRGHSVQGLDALLCSWDVPVSVVHSETDYGSVQFCECCVINSAPLLSDHVLELCKKAAQVIDISGSLSELASSVPEYVGHKEIGKGNMDILMHRVKQRIDNVSDIECRAMFCKEPQEK